MSSWKRVALWLSLWMTKGAESFVVVVGPSSTMTTTTLLMVQRHEYLQPHFEAPPSPKESTLRMDRVIECAQGEGACSLEEMESMMKDMDELNENCVLEEGLNNNNDSRKNNCSEEALQARETLKEALASQIALTGIREKMDGMDVIDDWRGSNETSERKSSSSADNVEDHSFDHFVDYRAIGEYESH